MKVCCLVLLFASTATFAATLNVDLDVYEDYTPGRRAHLRVTEGSSVLDIDLYRSVYSGQVPNLGYCGNVGYPISFCNFTPGGDLSASFLLSSYLPITVGSLTLGGVLVPTPENSDYQISFSFIFSGGSPLQVQVGSSWGPQNLNADLNFSIVQLSTGTCVFCAYAPNATGSASGYNMAVSPYYPTYGFEYQAAGEIVPEPSSGLLILPAIVLLIPAAKTKRAKSFLSARSLVIE